MKKTMFLAAAIMLASASGAWAVPCKWTGTTDNAYCDWGDSCWGIDDEYSGVDKADAANGIVKCDAGACTCANLIKNCTVNGTLYTGTTTTSATAGDGVKCNGDYKAGKDPDLDLGFCDWGPVTDDGGGCWPIRTQDDYEDCTQRVTSCPAAGTSSSSTPTPSSSSTTPPAPTGTGYKIFAYDITNTSTQGVGANSKSIWDTDVFVYNYGNPKATITNPTNPHHASPLGVDEGVIKLKGVAGLAGLVGTDEIYSGAFVGIKAEGATGTKKIDDCTGGFSYWYKGDAHWFLLNFPGTVCDAAGTAAGDGSNKWGIKVTPAATTWTQKTVTISQFTLVNTWTGSKCTATNAGTVQLGKVEQMVWGFDDKQTGTNLMIADVVCLNSGTETYSTATPDAAITVSTGYFSGNGFPSSSSGTTTPDGSSSSGTPGSSSSGTTPTGGSSSSGTTPTGGSSSSDGSSPIVISRMVSSNALTAMQNAVNLQSKGDATIQIFDLKGNAVRTLKFSQGSYVVPLYGLPKGLYIVKASNASWKQTIKATVK